MIFVEASKLPLLLHLERPLYTGLMVSVGD